jgi:large subunit ribosomal protein L13
MGAGLTEAPFFWYSPAFHLCVCTVDLLKGVDPEEILVKTYVPKQGDIQKKWYVIDAENQVLGRVAVEAARILRGKHKPQYTPFLDCGDHVIIVNAEKARVTGNKGTQKKYYRHSGYPGGLTEQTYNDVLAKHPTRAMMLAIKGMLPHNRLGRALATNVRVYAGPNHPHQAQNPEPRTLPK